MFVYFLFLQQKMRLGVNDLIPRYRVYFRPLKKKHALLLIWMG